MSPSHTFSCQLSSTLMACPPPSPPPKFRPEACVNPPAWAMLFRDAEFAAGGATKPIPLYKYFMRVSQISDPPSDWYIRWRMGVISACRIDCKISVTVLRWIDCATTQYSYPVFCSRRLMTHLSLLVCTIRWVLQCSNQCALGISSS